MRHIERELAKDRTLDSDYLDSSFGYQPFVELTTRLLFKPRYERVKNNVNLTPFYNILLISFILACWHSNSFVEGSFTSGL